VAAVDMEEGEATVLVPGLFCTPRLYAAQLPALWRCGPVFVADHRRDDSVAGIAARLLAQAPPVFSLVGLSMGGYVAFEVLRQAPERVRRLALLDTSARPDTPEQTSRRLEQIARAEAGEFGAVVDAAFPGLVAPSRAGSAELRAVVAAMAQNTGAEAFVRQQRAILSRPDSRPLLARVACPTLVLCGEEDQLTPVALSEEMAANIPGARLVRVPASGHLSTLEQPDDVTRALVAHWLA